MIGSAIGSAAGGIASAVSGGKGAKAAARAEEDIANKNRQMYQGFVDTMSKKIDPYDTAGTNALTAQENLLGLNGSAGTGAQQQAFDNFNNSTGYNFARNQGLDSINSNAYASGLGDSGATLKALQDRGTQLANQQFNQYYNDLNGLGSQGLNSLGLLSNTMSAGINGMSNANNQAAQARSSGILGQSSAISNGINSAVSGLSSLGGILSNSGSSSYSDPFAGSGTTSDW